MRASTYDNQCFEHDRNAQSDSLLNALSTALHHRDKSPSTVTVPTNPLKVIHIDPSTAEACFNLRKRSFSHPNNNNTREVGLSTYNSSFLSGLFADIAKANETNEVEDPRMELETSHSSPCKKSRLSRTKSISRCGKSFANLQAAVNASSSLKSKAPILAPILTPCTDSTNSPIKRDDSLSYQLHCVSSASSNESDSMQTAAIGKIAFPQLPATVSNSSCSQLARLTRRNSGQLLPESETDSKESYGWFVNVDDDDESRAPLTATDSSYAYASSSSLGDLAFFSAPKRANRHDAEVEWAKAADTVDDVLGDFF
jgi:hypothetical protein